MVQESDIVEIGSPLGLEAVFNDKFPKLWCSGEEAILNRKLLAVLAARETDSDLAAKSRELLEQLASLKEVAFISGWHSPLEKEALRVVSAGSAQIVLCIAKSLQRFIPPANIEDRVKRGDGLLLTHCSPKAKRISREASLRRNQLVMGLAGAVLILSAPEGSGTLEIAKAALRHEKPVLTLEERVNKELLECGALPANLENIQKSLR